MGFWFQKLGIPFIDGTISVELRDVENWQEIDDDPDDDRDTSEWVVYYNSHQLAEV